MRQVSIQIERTSECFIPESYAECQSLFCSDCALNNSERGVSVCALRKALKNIVDEVDLK